MSERSSYTEYRNIRAPTQNSGDLFLKENLLLKKLLGVASATAFIVLFAFALRMAYLGRGILFTGSFAYGAETGAVAAAIASGKGFSSPLPQITVGPTAWLTPIYPYLLAGIFKLGGIFTSKSLLAIRLLDMFFSALTCWPLRRAATIAFGKRVGTASAWLWAVLPDAIFYPVIWVWDTALTGLCLTALFAATLKIRGSSRMTSWIGYGALWAFSAMVNPSVLSVLPFLAIWAIWPLRAQLTLALKLALMASVIFMAGIAPWSIRNYVVFHRFIPFRSTFGLVLWLGNNPEVPDTWAPFLYPSDNPEEAAKYARMTEIPYMEEKQSEALAFMRTHPRDSMRFFFRRFAHNWLGVWDAPADMWRFMPSFMKLTLFWNCLFSVLSFVGAFCAYRARSETALPFASVMLMFPMVYYMTNTSGRYRYPMDPIMAILTVFAIAYPLSQLGKRTFGKLWAAESEKAIYAR
jgi:4-amino-4-deoxy-L-arabinose transferase-like glycosyltransferase